MSVHWRVGILLALVGCGADDALLPVTDLAPAPDAAVAVDLTLLDFSSGLAVDRAAPLDTRTLDAAALDARLPVDDAVSDLPLDAALLDAPSADSFATPTDAAAARDAARDGAALDALNAAALDAAPLDAALDSTPPDLTPLFPPGSMRVATGNVSLLDLTDDDWVVYTDLQSTVYAVSIAGGAPQTLLTHAAQSPVVASGKVVFSWNQVNGNDVGSLVAWSSTTGYQQLSSSSLRGMAAATRVGSHVGYSSQVKADGTGDLFVADLAQPRLVPIRVAAGVTVSPAATCGSTFDINGASLLLAICSASTGTTTLSSLDAAFQPRTLLQGLYDQTTYLSGPGVEIGFDTSSRLMAAPVDGSSPAVVIERSAGWPAVLSSDGKTVFYTTSAQSAQPSSLRRSPVTGASSTTLVPTGVAIVDGVSPDDQYVVYATRVDSSTGQSDLWYAPAVTPGTPIAMTTLVNSYGYQFSLDMQWAVYSTDADATGSGKLWTRPIGAGAGTQRATRVWDVVPYRGSRFVFNDGYTQVAPMSRGDLRTLDAATGNTTLIAAQADLYWRLSSDRTKVIFAYNVTGGPAGIWVAPLP